jgi:hypothetical protein
LKVGTESAASHVKPASSAASNRANMLPYHVRLAGPQCI